MREFILAIHLTATQHSVLHNYIGTVLRRGAGPFPIKVGQRFSYLASDLAKVTAHYAVKDHLRGFLHVSNHIYLSSNTQKNISANTQCFMIILWETFVRNTNTQYVSCGQVRLYEFRLNTRHEKSVKY